MRDWEQRREISTGGKVKKKGEILGVSDRLLVKLRK